jgi:hypothetical protein
MGRGQGEWGRLPGSIFRFSGPIQPGVPARAFGVTIEKAEGSATPTAPIILVSAIPAAGE